MARSGGGQSLRAIKFELEVLESRTLPLYMRRGGLLDRMSPKGYSHPAWSHPDSVNAMSVWRLTERSSVNGSDNAYRIVEP